MNRGLFGFVAVVTLVFAAVVTLAVRLGPNGLAFVLHDERKTAPFVMVELLDFADTAAEIRYRQGFGDSVQALVETLGGHLLWEGRLDGVLEGRLQDEWPVVTLVQYPSRSVYVDLVTSSEYRELAGARDGALERSAALAGSPRAAFEAAGGAFALRFVRGLDDGWRSRYDAEWQAEDATILERHGGHIAWRASLSPLEAEAPFEFDEVWLYAFADTGAREAWSEDIERRTVKSLEQRLFERDVVILLRPSAAGALPAQDAPAEDASESVPEHVNGTELVEFAEVREGTRVDVGEAHEAVDR